MLRGAIEKVQGNTVGGWIYSPSVDLRGLTVLAFVDSLCVGGGKVEIKRNDLAEAGLDDGRFGFSFPVTLADPADGKRLIVKLEGSDALLVQATSRIVGAAGPAPKLPQGALGMTLETLQWMQGRGWLSQSDYDFLRFFRQLGVYDRTLTIPVERPDRLEADVRDPAHAVGELMGLMHLGSVETVRVNLPSTGDVAAFLKKQGTMPSVIALWARERARLDIVEGSHLQADRASSKASVEYALGPDRLLFIDARCTFGEQMLPPPPSGIEVFLNAAEVSREAIAPFKTASAEMSKSPMRASGGARR
ncbi:hypothetical protein [Roseococcus suduntuyensis]|uniref:Uncharacterized protein n=1 Tax=Roseococcus suduntuyensis TaxID=455361 RepID=A0A840AHP2_9PROT|nr:hypothetical protein [Roseococcus suduntuyensis]MBB3900507.1 hypothetical protein [Roseococcus suduntuyensis]